MSSENYINIRLTLKGVETFGKNLNKTAANLNRFANDVRRIGTSLTIAGAVITGPLALAFNSAGKYSEGVRTQVENLKNTFLAFQISVANSMIPVVEKLSQVLARLYQFWNAIPQAVRNNIIQTTLWTGILLTASGVLLTMVGNMGRLFAALMRVGVAMGAFIAMHAPILLIVGAFAAFLAVMVSLKGATSVLNDIEIGFTYMGVGILKVKKIVIEFYDSLLAIQDWFNSNSFVKNIPLLGDSFAKTADAVKSKRESIKASLEGIAGDIQALNDKAARMMGGENGQMARGLEALKTRVEVAFSGLKDTAIPKVQELAETMDSILTNTSKQIAQAMQSAFGDIFFNVFTGQVKELKNVFADFGRMVLRIISQMIASMIFSKFFGSAFGGGGGLFFHQGGLIKAHSGYLAKDEVPIIAQTGERVLSRRQNKKYESMMQGSGGGGVTINITPMIQLWDTSDVIRNQKTLTAVIGNAISSNADIRRIIKQYG